MEGGCDALVERVQDIKKERPMAIQFHAPPGHIPCANHKDQSEGPTTTKSLSMAALQQYGTLVGGVGHSRAQAAAGGGRWQNKASDSFSVLVDRGNDKLGRQLHAATREWTLVSARAAIHWGRCMVRPASRYSTVFQVRR